MNKLISAKMQKAKQSLWIILAFIPFVNFLGFLYIGYRADRKKWTDMGKGYLILNLVSACFFWCTHTFHFRVNETIEIVSNILFAFVFVSALVLQLYASVDYLKLHRSEKSVSHELLNNRLWKTIQSSPMLLPLVGVLFYLASGTFEGVVSENEFVVSTENGKLRYFRTEEDTPFYLEASEIKNIDELLASLDQLEKEYGRNVQAFTYRRVMDSLEEHGMSVVTEEILEDDSVLLRLQI